MIRFSALLIWEALRGYEFVMRLDEDSFIWSRISYNIFTFMKSNNLDYGYRQVAWESGFTGEYFHTVIREYLQQQGLRPQWLLDSCPAARASVAKYTRDTCGDLFGFYNNFFVTRVGFWTSDSVSRFLRHVDDSGTIYTHRWGDLLWHSTAVQIFMPKERVHMFSDFTYEHATRAVIGDGTLNMTCVLYGGLSQGMADERGCDRALRFMHTQFCGNAKDLRTNGAVTSKMGLYPCLQILSDGEAPVLSVTGGLTSVAQPSCARHPAPAPWCSANAPSMRRVRVEWNARWRYFGCVPKNATKSTLSALRGRCKRQGRPSEASSVLGRAAAVHNVSRIRIEAS